MKISISTTIGATNPKSAFSIEAQGGPAAQYYGPPSLVTATALGLNRVFPIKCNVTPSYIKKAVF
jgi:hypothetical protein